MVELTAHGQIYRLLADGATTFGRGPDNTIVVDDATVSGHHAEVQVENGQWVVRDLGSTNGTYVSYGGVGDVERRVARNALKEGSIVRIGQARFQLRRDDGLGGGRHR